MLNTNSHTLYKKKHTKESRGPELSKPDRISSSSCTLSKTETSHDTVELPESRHSRTITASDQRVDGASEHAESLAAPVAEANRQDPLLLCPEDQRFHLPRSSPVMSRSETSSSRRGETERLSPSSRPAPSGGEVQLRTRGVEETAAGCLDVSCNPRPCQAPQTYEACGGLGSANLNHSLSGGLHLLLGEQQVLVQDNRGEGQRPRCSSDNRPRPASDSKDKRPRDFADIFKTSCDLEKENAHFIVVDMVLEAFEAVKWTITLSQRSQAEKGTDRRPPKDGTDPHHPKEDTNLPHPEEGTNLHHPKDGTNLHHPEEGTDPHHPKEDTHPHHPEEGFQTVDQTAEKELANKHSSDGLTILSRLSADSGFEDYAAGKPLLNRGSLRNSLRCPMMHCPAEGLAQQLVIVFKQCWFPSQEVRRGRHSLRTSLQELPGTEVVVRDGGVSLREEIRQRTRMRGTLTWAPPHFQIIFSPHTAHRRSKVVSSQYFLCAGCGTDIEPRYIKKLLYCHYLGKYFCDCCHSGSELVVPGRVLAHWDFGRYSVSDFSKQLLDSIWHQPLFDLTSVGKTLYGRARELDKFRELQEQIICIKRLLTACRLSDRVMQEFEQLPGHLTEEQHLFSMDDLLRVKRGQLVPLAKTVLRCAITHVENCQLCLARGFICEFCRQKDVLFPFQRDTCTRCKACRACFHTQCFRQGECPKCARIQERKQLFNV
ncbi:run domain Beclin-1-interacting and cysteine-rich domain-containing protein [Aplochiton taeniatus]